MDGRGGAAFRADVAVRDGVIVEVRVLASATAARVIDVSGKLVTPGFIDIHSHADDNARGRPTLRDRDVRRRAAPNLVTQGITTVVVNQDGRSPWPIADQRSTLERQGTWAQRDPPRGHGEIRRRVMGTDVMRPATDVEVHEMRGLVRTAMEHGAFGLSTGLEYNPGRWSTTEEIAALAGEIVPWDGVYISHERSEGSDPMWFWPSQDDSTPPTLLDAVAETIEIGRRSGARVVASHLKAKGEHYLGKQRARDRAHPGGLATRASACGRISTPTPRVARTETPSSSHDGRSSGRDPIGSRLPTAWKRRWPMSRLPRMCAGTSRTRSDAEVERTGWSSSIIRTPC